MAGIDLFGTRARKLGRRSARIKQRQLELQRQKLDISRQELDITTRNRLLELQKGLFDTVLQAQAIEDTVPVFAIREQRQLTEANIAGSSVHQQLRDLFSRELMRKRAAVDTQIARILQQAKVTRELGRLGAMLEDIDMLNIGLQQEAIRLQKKLTRLTAANKVFSGILSIAGAAIGTIIAPGIGTIAGATLGRSLGEGITGGDVGEIALGVAGAIETIQTAERQAAIEERHEKLNESLNALKESAESISSGENEEEIF